MYKSWRSITYTYLFLGFTLLSIFSAMTIIACSQKIIAESNRCMMFDADERLAGAIVRQTKRLTDSVSLAFELALFLFFIDTAFCVLLYFGTNNWVVPGGNSSAAAHVREPPDHEAWNPNFIFTSDDVYHERCSNPYDENDNRRTDAEGSILATAYVGISGMLVLCYFGLRVYVTRRYAKDSLEALVQPTFVPRHLQGGATRAAAAAAATQQQQQQRTGTSPLMSYAERRIQ